MLRLALVVTLIAAIGVPALACPPGPCNKYKRQPPQTIHEQVAVYVRSLPGAIPSDRRRLATFLTAAAWDPDRSGPATPIPAPDPRGLAPINYVPAPRIRFIAAIDARRTQDTAVRVVFLRRIERRAGLTMVEIDGEVWTLGRCTSKRRATACLTRRTDLSFEPIDETNLDTIIDGQQQFAKPPP